MFYKVYLNTYKLACMVHGAQCNKFPMIHFTKELVATVVQYDDKMLK